MNIGEAVFQLKQGKKVYRSNWDGKNMYLVLATDANEDEYTTFLLENHVLLKTAQDTLIPWTCSQADLLADDWGLYTLEDNSAQRIIKDQNL